MATTKLSLYVENPDNPSTATDEELERIAGKLRRVPSGLCAMRIAYVTDGKVGPRMVISGNKRLRCLKLAFGKDGEVPAEWFADITEMTDEQRREFIVDANTNDGSWDPDKLLAQYSKSELEELIGKTDLDELLKDIDTGHDDEAESPVEERELAPFAKAFFLVSVPISEFGKYAETIANLREMGATVDECLN